MSRVTPEVIEGITKSLLALRYDDPKPIPAHHREMWDLCCSDHPQIAIAAPRGSAKSTAITFAYVLACVLFREHHHVLIISANEELASAYLNDIKIELQENDTLANTFSIKKFLKERENELIVQFKDNTKFRILVKGAEQRMRGLKWERKRPSLVVVDDVEDEELVASDMRREKFRRWFYGAVKPILRDGGIIRVVGTIMHMDSLLNRLMPPAKSAYTVHEPLRTYTKASDKKPAYAGDTPDRAWKAVLYRAHDPHFEHLLWPEMYPAERLKAIRQDFAEQGMLDVYGQEYLNDPIDESTAHFRRDDLLPIDSWEKSMIYYSAADLAITEGKRSAYSVIIVGGLDADRVLNIVDVRRGRWDSLEIANEMFSVQERYSIDTFRLESENIARTLTPYLYDRMGSMYKGRMQEFINLDAKTPTKDKIARSVTIRAMMRAGRVRFNKDADWYPDLEEELLKFPKWPTRDQVDALAWLGHLIHDMAEGLTPQEEEEEEYQEMMAFSMDEGRCEETGY